MHSNSKPSTMLPPCYSQHEQVDVRQIARHIVANPLRAGLVRNIGDYPHRFFLQPGLWLTGCNRPGLEWAIRSDASAAIDLYDY
jgi:hypothetical protein